MAAMARSVGGRSGGSGAVAELAALESAGLDALKERYPEDWTLTGQALVAALEARHADGAAQFLARARAEAAPWQARLRKSGGDPRVAERALRSLVRDRMARLAVKEAVDGALAALAGGPSGAPPTSLRFGRWSGSLVQALFFRRGLQRKPVSLRWFRALWPLVTQKAALMPLVEPHGIYCFYSRPLIAGLRRLIDEVTDEAGSALEIAAGDGTLSRFLRAAGAEIHATDDQSWSHRIAFPADVARLDAESALEHHSPRVVICSWPPPGNGFERRVFRIASVRRYVVLTTRHRFAAGDWSAYDDAPGFDRRVDDRLSPLILPPHIDPQVLIFDRRG
jgi:hypothetical protein